ncbi:MAG: hypothetical protein JRN33_04120 [Nitrososphaerota archaeon]|nr:hypothetical protein [Nitrososphaerota archaeon]
MDVHRGVAIKGASLNWYQDRKVEEDVVLFAERLHAGRLSKVLDFGCGTGRNTVYPCQDGIRGARLRMVYCVGHPLQARALQTGPGRGRPRLGHEQDPLPVSRQGAWAS